MSFFLEGGTAPVTREQERAQRAYDQVSKHRKTPIEAEYNRFSKSYPALLHTCGLAQAIAYGQAKAPHYMEDLAYVVGLPNVEGMARAAREAPLPIYQKQSRDTLAAATWIKRYAEALLEGE